MSVPAARQWHVECTLRGRRVPMREHRGEGTDQQLDHHSLPGTNMAGKGPGDACPPSGDSAPQGQRDRTPQPSTPDEERKGTSTPEDNPAE